MPGFDSDITFDSGIIPSDPVEFPDERIVPDIFVTHATNRSLRLMWVEVSAPVSSAPTTRAQCSWTELEVPGSTNRRGELSLTEFQVPGNWIAPIGLPTPAFGIDDVTPTFDSGNTKHYYIDNTDPNATDTSNPNGSVATPRLTLPASPWAAGTYIEIHGVTYTPPTTLTGNGTAASPVFLTGKGTVRPRLSYGGLNTFAGSYFIVEHLEFIERTAVGTSSSTYAVMRDCDCHLGGSNQVRPHGTNVVIYNNHIHHTVGVDRHGVTPGADANGIWIVDNEIDNCTGDGIQYLHASAPPGPQNVYIGRNVIHHNFENGVDLKTSTGTIVSQNEIYGHKDVATSDGTAIVCGSNGLGDPAKNAWFIFNHIHDNDGPGIRIEAAANTPTTAGPAYIIGNLIRGGTKGVAFDKDGIPIYIVNNTLYQVDVAFDQYWQPGFDLEIWNNVVHTIYGQIYGRHVNVESSVVTALSEMSNNCFYRGGSSLIVGWPLSTIETYVDTADMTTNFSGGSNNKIEDPLFVNTAGLDFKLQAGSPAIGAGVAHAVYTTFEDLWGGRSIRFDFDGVARPQGAAWDMGAFERV